MHTRQGVDAVPALFEDSAAEPDIYPLELNQDGTTKHSRHCKAVFARRDWRCHRCMELMRGAAPRGGWQHRYFGPMLRQTRNCRTYPKLPLEAA